MRKHHIFMRLFSIFLSVVLWFYVINQENPTRQMLYRDIPVMLNNTDRIRIQHNLVLSDEENPSITVGIQGNVNALKEIKSSDISAWADVSSVDEAGEYTLSYSIGLPNGLTVISRSPSNITVHFDELITRELPVKVYIAGDMPQDYEAETAVADPLTVSVTGLRHEVEQLSAAQISVEGSQLTKSFSGDLEYVMVDKSDNVVKDANFTFETPKVHVSIEVLKRKLLPLAVKLKEGQGAGEQDARVVITPAAVQVKGDIAAIDALESLVLGEVDLASFTANYAAAMRIQLPEGIELLDEARSATVEIDFPGLDTKQIVVNDITVINIPLRYSVTLDTKSVPVTVRGPKQKLENLVSGDISLVVDLQGMTLINGMQPVKATVVLGPNARDLGIFGEYRVVIHSIQMPDPEIVD